MNAIKIDSRLKGSISDKMNGKIEKSSKKTIIETNEKVIYST
jgi:hypothetical protein